MFTVQTVIDCHLQAMRLRHQVGDLQLDTLKSAERYLKDFARRFGQQQLQDCRRHDLVVWLSEHPTWKSNSTKNDGIRTVIGCFRWAEDDELIERSPYRRPRGLKLTCLPRKPMQVADYVRIMRAAHRWGKGSRQPAKPKAPALAHGPYRAPKCQVGPANVRFEDLSPEQRKLLGVKAPRQQKFSKEEVRSWALKVLAQIAGLS